MREHLEAGLERAQFRYGDDAPETAAVRQKLIAIDQPTWPEYLDYLHAWFVELQRTRRYDMSGAVPLDYPALDAWARLSGRTPTPTEVDVLLRLDLADRVPGKVRRDAPDPARTTKRGRR